MIHRRRTCWQVILAAAIAAGPGAACLGAQQAPAAEELTDAHVRQAIDAIVEELYARKDPTRFWESPRLPAGESRQVGGYTALTVLALVSAGQSYQDPRLRDAVEYLRHARMDGTYAIALRASLWAKLPPRFRDDLRADLLWLLEGFSDRAGGWTYRQVPDTTRRDNSITQYGALALWEAAKRDLNVESRYWRMLEDRFLDMQLEDGGWNYTGDGPATGSMTTAGLATLYITQDLLHGKGAVQIRPAPASRADAAIELGLEWMNEHFSPEENPGSFRDFYYYLYGVERVGLASGRKFLGGKDWFRLGASELIRRLCRWDPQRGTMTVHETVAGNPRAGRVSVRALTFALMFLSRGRVPVAVNKLQASPLAWNNRPRDVANLTRWIVDRSETALNWQVVSLASEPEAWLDAPVLYLASDQRLPWLAPLDIDAQAYTRAVLDDRRARASGSVPMDADPPELPPAPELERLRRFIELGGMMLAVNEGSSTAFADAIEEAGTLMFPTCQWRTLGDDHWAYTLVHPVTGKLPKLRGLANGVRDLIIVAPAGDLPRTLQARDEGRVEHFATLANIYYYASEKNRPRPRLAQHVRLPDSGESRPLPRMTIIRGLYDGNWNPEPLALEVFGHDLRDRLGVDLRVVDHPLADLHDLDALPALVLVCGTEAHAFTPAEQDAIKAFVARGGWILFETPGGCGDFTRSAETMASSLLDGPIQSMLRSRVITGDGSDDARDLTRLDYRPYSFERFGARETTPRLRGMMIDGQPRVLFSREDISFALLDQPRWGVSGYTPQAARALLRNIILASPAGAPRR